MRLCRLMSALVAATNRNLEEEVKNGSFREDLYYRLNVVILEVPALRHRSGDIPLLVEHFVKHFSEKNRRTVDSVAASCMDLLSSYRWPGNVRELENAIERAVILMRGEQLSEKSLPLQIQKYRTAMKNDSRIRPETLQEAEKELILQTLEKTGGNKSEASRRLGITRKTLQNKLQRYEDKE